MKHGHFFLTACASAIVALMAASPSFAQKEGSDAAKQGQASVEAKGNNASERGREAREMKGGNRSSKGEANAAERGQKATGGKDAKRQARDDSDRDRKAAKREARDESATTKRQRQAKDEDGSKRRQAREEGREREDRDASKRERRARNDSDRGERGKGKREARGDGGTSINIRIGSDKRTRIKRRADRGSLRRGKGNVNVEFSVGTVLPRRVTLYSVPSFVVDIAPAYRDYRYYYDGNVLVIVDPDTYRVVDVIAL